VQLSIYIYIYIYIYENNVIDYDNLIYENIISTIQKEGLRMCIDMKISNQANKNKKNAKYEMGNFCEQYSLPSVAPSKKHKKSRKHEELSLNKFQTVPSPVGTKDK
jgi:hypothetical protein